MSRGTEQPTRSTAAPAWAAALSGLLAERWKNYRRQLKACRRKFSTESVHESRVAARRLRAALDLLAAVSRTKDSDKARRELKHHLRLFAALRDAQAQRASLPALRLPGEVRGGFESFLCRREQKASRRAKRGLKDLDARIIAKAVHRAGGVLARTASDLDEASLRAVAEARFRDVSQRRAQVDAQRPETIHATRVAFKRFRYSLELLAPLLPGRHPVRVAALRRYQALMGAVQDAAVSSEWFAAFAARVSGEADVLARVRQRMLRRRERAIARYLARADELRYFWPL